MTNKTLAEGEILGLSEDTTKRICTYKGCKEKATVKNALGHWCCTYHQHPVKNCTPHFPYANCGFDVWW